MLMMGYFILIILVLMPGVWSRDWEVTLENTCALRGATAIIKCNYDYPYGHQVTSVDWLKIQKVAGRLRRVLLSELPSPPDHFQFVGNAYFDCDLKISDVQPSDAGDYLFSFVTTRDQWRSKSKARLSVHELTAAVRPTTVSEGDDVHLTCMSGCNSLTYVWFRDGQTVQKPVFKARREDAGSYQCTVPGQETAISAPVALNVLYAPKNVTLSTSPRGDIVRGSSVTFTCSCEANPAVAPEGYSLYKDGRLLRLGRNHTIYDLQPSHSGRYHCQAWNNISWGGSYTINSTDIHLDVQYEPMNVSVSVEPQQVAEGSSVNLTCSSVANPAADSYTWYRRTQSPSSSSSSSSSSTMVQVGSGQMLFFHSMETSHSGLYCCQARNSVGESNSTVVLLALNGTDQGSQSLLIIAGLTGVVVGVALVTALLWFVKKQRTNTEKKAAFDSRTRGLASSVTEDQLTDIYANVNTVLSSARLTPTSDDVDVIYTTVTIAPKATNVTHDTNSSRAQEEPGSKAAEAEEEDSVVYATVAKSRGS